MYSFTAMEMLTHFFQAVTVVNYVCCCDRCSLFFILSVLDFQELYLYCKYACMNKETTFIEFLLPALSICWL